MSIKEKKRCHIIACAIAHLHMSYSLLYTDPVLMSEIESLIIQSLEKDLDKGLLSGVLSDYKINIVEPKSKKALLKITITK